MKNIEYLESFFRKHNLSGRIKVKYQDTQASDEYMSDIEFDNGRTININDIIFDIESELEPDVYDQWMEDRRTKEISLSEWIGSNNHYKPTGVDTESIEEYHKEVEELIDEATKLIDQRLTLQETKEGEDD